MAKNAFDQREDKNLSCEDWQTECRKCSVNAEHWFTVMELEVLLCMLVRSLREANFDLIVRCIQDSVPWMFALDHTSYARWISVFVSDLSRTPQFYDVFQNFTAGAFTAKKSDSLSNIGEDQAHEQQNKIVKIDGGAIGILENDDALQEWATADPQIAEILEIAQNVNRVDDDVDDGQFRFHHEDTAIFEGRFRKERDAIKTAFYELGNPFQERESVLLNIATCPW